MLPARQGSFAENDPNTMTQRMDTTETTAASPDNAIGPYEYFERREHDKLHEKLDFLM